MSVDPPPPPITVVDPNNPTGTPDLLHNGRDPWRPSRRRVVVAGALLLLVAVAGAALMLTRHVQRVRALDRQALRGVNLLVTVDGPGAVVVPDLPVGSVQLELFNQGSTLIHVTSVRLDDDAEYPVATGSDLLPGAVTGVTLERTSKCAADAGRSTHTVTVRLRTHRAQAVTKVQHLGSDELLNSSERQRCGTLTPTEALASSVVSATTRGRWVAVVVDVRNTSVLPLDIRTLTVPAGVQVVLPHLPLQLPPAAAPQTTGPSRQLRLRLRVTDCDAFSAALQGAFQGFMEVRLHGALEDEVGHMSIEPSQETGFGVDAPDAQFELMNFCPGQFFD